MLAAVHSRASNRRAFLSSLYTEHKNLRSDIYDLNSSSETEIWVAEKSEPSLIDKEPLEIVDTLIERVRQSDLFICVLGGPHPSRGENDHGTPIKVAGRPSNVSYFEIELYQAAMLRKPIHLFIAEGFNPDKRLKALLEIIRFALPNHWPMPMNDKEILAHISDLLSEKPKENRSLFTTGERVFHRLVRYFDDYRSVPVGSQAAHPEVVFLDGQFEARRTRPDKELIELLLHETSVTSNEERKLARLWLTLRELMAAPYTLSANEEYRPLWSKALGRWASAAAWYGLHGHIYLGCLAAFHSVAQLSELMLETPIGKADPKLTQYPGGGLASAYYSIAWFSRPRRNLNKALWHLEKSLAERRTDISGLLSIRGNINRRLWHPFRAVDDHKEALRLLENSRADEGRIGAALSDLGYAYLFTGNFFKGRRYLVEAVCMLQNVAQSGFLVRAKKKLAVAYAVTGQLGRAKQERDEANRIAHEKGILDQINKGS